MPSSPLEHRDLCQVPDRMIVTCPNCAAKYKIDEAAIGEKGRMVSCANCRHRWFVAPDLAEADLPAEPRAVALAGPAVPERSWQGEGTGPVRRGSPSTAFIWLLALLAVAGVVVLIAARDTIATAWPPISDLYRAVGLSAVVDPGLEIRNVASSEVNEGGQRVLVVTGEVVNTTDYAKNVPPLRVALLDDDRNEVASDIVPIEPKILEARATTSFEKRLHDIPPNARQTAVHIDGIP